MTNDKKTQAIKAALAALTQNATFPADIALAVKARAAIAKAKGLV